ncbi:Holliday junction DNA helicase RuvA [candidate division WOR-1 bacterium RIFOXYB2_FULL_42_35]|uniref:Holliday junction branch migration complex subunit RuvA n=1 Tax=candidate division WOR-1 bacterium RIFOXYC2_FULL_41_25 TaxID=1802586 RepID=A0A1F4TJF0_UNCSA|nr:MAG: Holliday junction DNA helicase RuvA [candidate division WOR-1 bacterium RIFOXYA2_FULL_41_14]OGC21791.1 MAG: Holliday junction DNA helicase RuvA [candidate division WOR-1 bacterium RIFOXYB2_FULL_42_35]OGC32689.1 MAG: Holliday junction DNA helicase RuvA [candidate division WOR-1 bacterium RIFOXYC2_FULL_41_25]OGC41550.1 MAG: Holliday junction DNA helicase RuvA [candidate division WOR-1 bacterium RIFOXYD2_FULL_41_8]
MISHLKGILEHVAKDHIVVDVGNVGYYVKVSAGTLAKLPKPGEKVHVYTYQVVREDDISLYGFITKEEKNLFALLLSVSGIGPKASLALLSSFPIDKLATAITNGNVGLISTVPGIGKKTAQKLVIELKEKVAKAYALKAADTGMGIPDTEESPQVADAISALVSLGYSSKEARSAIAQTDVASNDVEVIIKQALKSLV